MPRPPELRVLIADDEAPARELLKEFCQHHPDLIVVGEASHGLMTVKLAQELQPQLLLLDVQMPKLNGFEVLELLDQQQGVIFTTAHDQYAVRAFEVNAVDYLLKPITQGRFDAALAKVRSHTGVPRGFDFRALVAASRPVGVYAERLVIKDGARIELLSVQELDYARAQGDYVELVSGKKSWLKEQTLQDLETSLDPARFVRVHRSFILNGERLARLEPMSKDSKVAILKTGAQVPVSQTGMQKLAHWLTQLGP